MLTLRHPRNWPIWDPLFPPLCAVCSRPLGDSLLFCTQCWAEAPIVESDDLPNFRHVDSVRIGYRFGGDDVVKAAVHALKYERLRLVAGEMAKHLVSSLPLRFVEVETTWTPVPLHWFRRMQRGFNQSTLIAEALAPLVTHLAPQRLIERVRNTPTQTALSLRERAANVKNAFRVSHLPLTYKRVLLIDDVITTGATMDECARCVKSAGAEWVGALAFALSWHR